MVTDRAVKLFIVLVVLAGAWYAGHETAPAMAAPVAIVGLVAALCRAVLGIPVALVMLVLAVYAPGVAVAATVFVAVVAVMWALVKFTTTVHPAGGGSVSPGSANLYLGPPMGGVDGGGDCDGGAV